MTTATEVRSLSHWRCLWALLLPISNRHALSNAFLLQAQQTNGTPTQVKQKVVFVLGGPGSGKGTQVCAHRLLSTLSCYEFLIERNMLIVCLIRCFPLPCSAQCARLIEDFPDVAHYSAGDLLRAHVQSGTSEGNEVADMIKNGAIVPAEITVGLLQKAMAESGKGKILIDGFPRNASNRETFLKMVRLRCLCFAACLSLLLVLP